MIKSSFVRLNPTLKLISEQNEEQEEKGDNVVELITGGKGPPTTSGDWLTPLPVGTMFFARNKGNPMDFNLGLFRVTAKEGKVVVLHSPQVPHNIYVDPVRFCNNFFHYEDMGILEIPQEQEETKKEEDNGNGDRVQGDDKGSDG